MQGPGFWLVHRTSDAALANLALEETTCELYCSTFVNKKANQSWGWDPRDMPKIAILTNRKAIKAHQRLAMFFEQKKEGSESRPSGASGSNENLENEES